MEQMQTRNHPRENRGGWTATSQWGPWPPSWLQRNTQSRDLFASLTVQTS